MNENNNPLELELTDEQIKRQDLVDNACYHLIRQLIPSIDSPSKLNEDEHLDWDIELITKVRLAVQEVICVDLGICEEIEFYPYMEEE